MNTGAPTLAVVIANFNYAQYLPQALDSVLDQSPPFDEVVVVDDGSTDNSLDVLARYADRITLLRIANAGQLGAVRAGIAATTASYIYALDADDYAAPGLVARVRAVIAGGPVKVQFQLRGVDSAGVPSGSVFPHYPPRYDAQAMREDNATLGFYICPTTSANVFSRAALDRIDLASMDGRGAFDASPALAMPYLGEIVSLNEKLAYYRVHATSLSGWHRPTLAVLERELALFAASWREVARAVGQSPATGARSLYVREREMLIACLEGQRFIAPLVWRFLAGLSRTHLPPKQKRLLSLWAIALLIPSARLRDYCIKAKRSGGNRSRALRWVLRVTTRGRPEPSDRPAASPPCGPAPPNPGSSRTPSTGTPAAPAP